MKEVNGEEETTGEPIGFCHVGLALCPTATGL